MPKSISTTSNTQITTNSTPATFKVGDAVLCPSLSSRPFVLAADPHGKRDLLALTFEGSYFYYDDKETGDFQPSLYRNTSNTQTSQRKVIDTTKADDKEVIVISSNDLSHIACDISGAITILNNIGQLLALIHYEKIEPHTAISMARLTHDAADTWATLLNDQLEAINEPLVMTGYNREVAR